MRRSVNFNAGPSALPESVLLEAQENLLNFKGTGMSVMELSHRSKVYEEVHFGAKVLLKKCLRISDEYEVLFLQGGASLQFSMIPMNLLSENKVGYYVLTGSWSEKAFQEAKKIGSTNVLASGKGQNYREIPTIKNFDVPDAAYIHLTSNNTIYGTQWNSFPDTSIPLIADMSSDILSRPLNVDQFSLIYAGAQKNLGPSGVTVVIMKKSLLTRSQEHLPAMLNYQIQAKYDSLYNTPPTFAIYLLKLVLEWVESQGGVEAISLRNEEKAKALYDVIDTSEGFYKGHADESSRSKMNVTFTLPNKDLSSVFQHSLEEKGFSGLNGHRSVGGFRASIYNAVPLDHVIQLADFMKKFQKNAK